MLEFHNIYVDFDTGIVYFLRQYRLIPLWRRK